MPLEPFTEEGWQEVVRGDTFAARTLQSDVEDALSRGETVRIRNSDGNPVAAPWTLDTLPWLVLWNELEEGKTNAALKMRVGIEERFRRGRLAYAIGDAGKAFSILETIETLPWPTVTPSVFPHLV